MSGIVAQLALVAGSSTVTSPKWSGDAEAGESLDVGGDTGNREGTALAFCSMAMRLFDAGHGTACDKVMALAGKTFPNTASPAGALWRACAGRIAFVRALRRTDWVGAARLVEEAESVERWSASEEGDSAGLANKDNSNNGETLVD